MVGDSHVVTKEAFDLKAFGAKTINCMRLTWNSLGCEFKIRLNHAVGRDDCHCLAKNDSVWDGIAT